jgi:hypothetical protein
VTFFKELPQHWRRLKNETPTSESVTKMAAFWDVAPCAVDIQRFLLLASSG